jgi:hypothetical protein
MKPISCGILCLLIALSGAQRPQPRPGRLMGHVKLGPVKPVERPGEKQTVPPALYKPYTVAIQAASAKSPFMVIKLSNQGNFAAELAPGNYVVSLRTSQKVMQLPPAQKVIITSGKTTNIKFEVDTGIR